MITIDTPWTYPPPGTCYRGLVWLTQEPDGSFTALGANLPGVGGHGDTEAQALANVIEAFQAALQTYRKHGEPIPWQDRPAPCFGAKLRHVVVKLGP